MSARCAVGKRPYPPGQQGKKQRRRPSDYKKALEQKQKLRFWYNLKEKQLKIYVKKVLAKQKSGEDAAMQLISLLEKRLDNVVFKAGFSRSRDQARQLVRHNHFLVNGRKVNIPSFQVTVGDEIALKEKSRKNELIADNLEGVARRGVPVWLELDPSISNSALSGE